MSILVVWASPNQDGLTSAAKDNILKGLSEAGGEAEALHLNKRDIRCCRACGNGWGLCRSEGRCVINDDFSEDYQRLVSAEAIVWITPVYWHDLAENLKAFLDRLRRCETRRNHFLKGKKSLLVACAGGTGRGAIQCLDRLEDTLGHMDIVAVDRLPIIRFNREYMLPALLGAGRARCGAYRANGVRRGRMSADPGSRQSKRGELSFAGRRMPAAAFAVLLFQGP